MLRILFTSLCLLLLSLNLWAQSPAYDGLTILGVASKLTDEQGANLQLIAFHTKYKEKVVGLYFQRGDQEVRFYMNGTTWDKFKQDLLKARDQWSTLEPRLFEREGTVKGYRIANQLATLRLSLQGATALSERRVTMSAAGGADRPHRVSVAMKEDNLRELVDDFHKVDDFLRQP